MEWPRHSPTTFISGYLRTKNIDLSAALVLYFCKRGLMKSPRLERLLEFDTCLRARFERLAPHHAACGRHPEGFVGERGIVFQQTQVRCAYRYSDSENADQLEATTCQKERM